MPSLADLTPAERARLLGKPEGELGIALGEVMNSTNGSLIAVVYRRLGLEAGQSVLEIGFGNGHTVPLLMQQAELHRSAGFLTVEVEPFDELSKTGDGTPIQRHYHLAIATR